MTMTDTHATPTLSPELNHVTDNTTSGDALLYWLQRRLLFLATVDRDDTAFPTAVITALKQLITRLYTAQQNAVSAIATPTLADDNIDLAALMATFPTLISSTTAQQPTPIVVFADFVAFRRDWQQLDKTAAYLQRGVNLGAIHLPHVILDKLSWQLAGGAMLSDEQKLAAITAATQPFSVITGGAGTGKTTTLAKALELCLLENPQAEIQLAAPTGKAAHRLNESLAAQIDSVDKSVRPQLALLQAKTIHRLLGIAEHSGRPFYHANNPLSCDVLAIDEASMLGGDLFNQIQAATLPQTRLILLGDANQLPAINTSAFFTEVSQLPVGYSSDFCQSVNPYLEKPITAKATPLPNAICRLSIARRFAEKSLIEQAGDAILARRYKGLIDLLGKRFYPLSNVGEDFIKQLASAYPNDKTALLQTLSQRKILTANRQGLFGSELINRYLDNRFRQLLGKPQSAWYAGRQIIIEQNDYQLNINNGDIGYCQWRDSESAEQRGGWQIVFDDGRQIPVSVLAKDKYSLAFAITIHKSQGSEYPHVDVVLDSFDKANPNQLINPALLYTAITRAKQDLTVYADAQLLAYALSPTDCPPSPLLAWFEHKTAKQ